MLFSQGASPDFMNTPFMNTPWFWVYACLTLGIVVPMLAQRWAKVRIVEAKSNLILELAQQGMSPEQIESILKAGGLDSMDTQPSCGKVQSEGLGVVNQTRIL